MANQSQSYYYNSMPSNELVPVYYNTNQRSFYANNNQPSLYAHNNTETNNQQIDVQVDFQNDVIPPEESMPSHADKQSCLNRLYVSGALMIFFALIILILKYFGKI